ncbi:hypothetical protein B7486_71205 [cyanobacterium TDX16]|nr:hypothetical protein B7486_71205 [cyanobacterium TDX16]
MCHRSTCRRPLLALALAMCLGLSTACGGSDDVDREAVPTDEAGGFSSGAFDDLPRLPGSDLLDAPTEVDGATTATFVVRGLTVDQVVVRQVALLTDEGWQVVEGPLQVGDATRADLVDQEARRRLEVSAFPATALEEGGGGEQGYDGAEAAGDDEGNAVQYSLVLLDGLADPGTSTSTSTVPSG